MSAAISSPTSFSSQFASRPTSSSAHSSYDLNRSILSNPKEFVTRNLNPRDPSLSSIALKSIEPICPPEVPPPPHKDNDATAASIDNEGGEAEAIGATLPCCSQWFDLKNIHAVERAQLPTLFADADNAAAQEQRYKAIRNLIVRTYRSHPRQYLSVTECRKFIDGDAAVLLRIHSFLDYWGVINFQADPSTLPSRSRKPKDFRLSDTMTTDSAADKNGFDKWGSKVSPAKAGGGPWKCAACGKICLYTYYVIRPGGTTGISMGVLDKCVWCLKCYAAGRYPAILNEKQFLKVELPIMGGEGDAAEEWTYEEAERLIEGIELYKEDWELIARHVGGDKSARQCVAYFIQMPIEEPFMSDDEDDEETHQNSNSESDAKQRSKIPFKDCPNPILTQLAFLASIVNPNVAAAAAKAALDAAVKAGIRSDEDVDMESQNSQVNASLPSKAEAKTPAGYMSDRDMQVLSSTALAAAAVRAKELAKAEEQEIKRLMPEVVDLQLQKLYLKAQHFKAIEEAIAQQKSLLESSLGSILEEHKQVSVQLDDALANAKP